MNLPASRDTVLLSLGSGMGIKPIELLKDLCMSRVKFRNIQEPSSGNSATLLREIHSTSRLQVILYCQDPFNVPASGDIALLSLGSGMRIKPIELLKDLCMSQAKFRNTREPCPGNSATLLREIHSTYRLQVILYC